MPCYTLLEDETWSDMVKRTHSLKIYNLDESRKHWDQESTKDLSLIGKVMHGLREVRPFCGDVAFLTYDSKENRVATNLIPH